MFKYYLSKEYRNAYHSLQKLGLLCDSITIKFSNYEAYVRELLLANTCIAQHIQILRSDKPTPIKIIKALLFIHAWLQIAPSYDNVGPFYSYMEHILKVSADLAKQMKSSKKVTERKRANSAILKTDFMSGEEIQINKEVFLLEKVVRPYVLNLQKLVSVFPFYCTLKKTLYRTLEPAQIWILLNLFKCGYAVTMHLPTITKFIRKSFNPIADGLIEAFSSDFNNFYPKLSSYIHDQCNRIQEYVDGLERKYGEAEAYKAEIDGLDDAVNLLQDISQLNKQLQSVYDETFSAFRPRTNIYRPKFVNLNHETFQFIRYIHRVKHSRNFGDQTPKFYRSHPSRPSEPTEADKNEQMPQLVPVFRDISNEEDNVCTFRKERHSHLVPRFKKRQDTVEND